MTKEPNPNGEAKPVLNLARIEKLPGETKEQAAARIAKLMFEALQKTGAGPKQQ